MRCHRLESTKCEVRCRNISNGFSSSAAVIRVGRREREGERKSKRKEWNGTRWTDPSHISESTINFSKWNYAWNWLHWIASVSNAQSFAIHRKCALHWFSHEKNLLCFVAQNQWTYEYENIPVTNVFTHLSIAQQQKDIIQKSQLKVVAKVAKDWDFFFSICQHFGQLR